MRGYDARRLHNKRILDERIRLAYLKEPRLEAIDHAISACSVSSARKLLEGDSAALSELHGQLEGYRSERAGLLARLGYPEDYFEPVYTCPDCRDTGYIDGRKCHCLKQAIINTIYTQSNIRDILEKENFQTFSYEYYSDDDRNPATGQSSLATVQNAVKECWNFIDDFEHKPKNLLLYGETGVGKTFLSNCVARELLDRSYSVIYFTAFQLFDIFSKGVFDKDADAIAANQNIFDCDLLIIDDLGTELSNSFTVSQLFLCVNERILRNRSTIISTNLSMNQIADTYSERTISRILSSYTIIRLFGDDIRIRKRQAH
jgi:DNA replication protein DnaC